MATLSSRPDESPGFGGITSLSHEELQLISAFLYVTRLGSGSPYRDAAFALMNRIENHFGDDFLPDAAADVDMKIDIIDQQGHVERSIGAHWIEIDV
jgi:hypothetical protein